MSASVRTLTADLMLGAYASGIFPMAENRRSTEVFWLDPKRRGVFPLEDFHLSRSLQRKMRRGGYVTQINGDFSSVVDACADREETWINPMLRGIYLELHRTEHAHSFEIRGEDGALWGAVFGLTIGGAWFGESMVSLVTDGSKLALAHLIDHLRRTGFVLFDTQFLTPHLASLGAREIRRAQYHRLLDVALERPASILACAPESDPAHVLHRMTHTS